MNSSEISSYQIDPGSEIHAITRLSHPTRVNLKKNIPRSHKMSFKNIGPGSITYSYLHLNIS
jgi:hypothetical protein